ncbi:hypothetical protein CR513_13229, partial [Mucuna pruriens]
MFWSSRWRIPQSARSIPLPFPTRTVSARRFETDEDLLKLFRKVPKYAKFLKELCIHKRKKMKGEVETEGIMSALIKHEDDSAGVQRILPKKCQDSGIFSMPCTIGNCTFTDVMLDLGASINIMLASGSRVDRDGDLTSQQKRCATLRRAQRCSHPVDFYVLDMEDEASGKGFALILGRPFLMMARTMIYVYAGTLSMEFGDTFMKFNIFEALKHPTEDHSIFSIDTIDGLVEEHMQMSTGSANLFEFVEISNILNCFYTVEAIANSNSLSHTLNFSNSEDYISDVIDCSCMIHEVLECSQYIQFRVADTSKPGVIRVATIEEAETDSINLDKAETNASRQQIARSNSSQKESQQAEAESNFGQPSPHIPPQSPTTDLKPLPKNLKYAYLEDHRQFLVIIANSLSQEQKEKLLNVLRKRKKAIGWTLADHPRINPSICMHKILLEEYARSIRQQQWRLNLTILDMVKKEVKKLHAAEIIYPISDSQWVSSVQVVPKKSRVTVVKNRQDDMVSMRIQNSWGLKLNQATHKDHFPLLFIGKVSREVPLLLHADSHSTSGLA